MWEWGRACGGGAGRKLCRELCRELWRKEIGVYESVYEYGSGDNTCRPVALSSCRKRAGGENYRKERKERREARGLQEFLIRLFTASPMSRAARTLSSVPYKTYSASALSDLLSLNRRIDLAASRKPKASNRPSRTKMKIRVLLYS